MTTPGRALAANAEYRKLFISRLISNVGNGMLPIALAFGVLALPGADATALSIVLAAQAVAVVIVLPFGGVIADRLGSARVISVTDIIMSAVSAAMAILFITGQATIPVLAVLAAIAGALMGLWMPAYPALIPDVVTDETHLQPANAFNSIASNSGMIVGAALGGFIVAGLGSGAAIAIDGVSFLLSGLLILSIRHVSSPRHTGQSFIDDMAHGWRIVAAMPWFIVVVVAYAFLVFTMRAIQDVMGPVLARDEYGGPVGWGVILSGVSVGLLVGAVVSTRFRPRRPMLVGMLATFALPLLLAAMTFALPLFWVAAAGFLWGLSLEFFMIVWYTTLQTQVPPEALSRVSSYDAAGSLILGPLGVALAGPLIGWIGLQRSLALMTVIAVIAVIASLLFRSVRELESLPSQR